MSCPDTGRRPPRRQRRPHTQAGPRDVAAPTPGRPRVGLVKRARGALVRRQVLRALAAPAAAPVVVVVVGVVLLAVMVGAVLGAAMATAATRAGEPA